MSDENSPQEMDVNLDGLNLDTSFNFSDFSASFEEFVEGEMPNIFGSIRDIQTAADLHGLKTPDPRKCRVLQLGAGAGNSLIAQAEEFPESEFLGTELSNDLVTSGRETIRDLGLTNCELRTVNLLNIDESWGKFDYIIVHGLFSWSEEYVQDKIFEICRENLSEDGVALISYNCNPGWLMRMYVRELMSFHAKKVNKFEDKEEEARQAKTFFEFIRRSYFKREHPYAPIFDLFAKRFEEEGLSHISQEYLADTNEPIYFSEFWELLEDNDLYYIADIDWGTIAVVADEFALKDAYKADVDTRLTIEQYLDYMRNCAFRASLVTHDDNRDDVVLHDDSIAMRYPMYVNTGISIQESSTLYRLNSENGRLDLPKNIFTDMLLDFVKANANEWYFTFDDIYDSFKPNLTEDEDEEKIKQILANFLTQMIIYKAINITKTKVQLASPSEDKPKITGFAQLFAGKIDGDIPTLKFDTYKQDDVDVALLPLLDGEHSVLDLAKELMRLKEEGKVTINYDELPGLDRTQQTAEFVQKRIARYRHLRLVPPVGE